MLSFPIKSPQSFLSVPVDLAAGERASPRTGTSPLLQHPDPGAQILSHFLPSFFSLPLLWVLSVYAGIFLVLPGAQGPRLMFSRGSVRTVPFIDVFLMCLWGEVNSTPSCASAVLTPLQRFWKSEPEESFQNLGTVNQFFGDD